MKITLDKKVVEIAENTTAAQLADLNAGDGVLCYKVNNAVVGRDFVFCEGDTAQSLTIATDEGYLIYKETLILVLLAAVNALFDKMPLLVRQSVNKSTYFELKTETPRADTAMRIKEKMREIIREDEAPIQFETDINSAAELFSERGEKKRAEDILKLPSKKIKLCRVKNDYRITYQSIAYRISTVANFDIEIYERGYLLRYPTNYSNGKIPENKGGVKIHSAVRDYRDWIETLGVKDIFSLNEAIKRDGGKELINLSEGLHEKRISTIADKICENKDIKTVLIAGPSSSGKTTFANRLKLHLRINHCSPIVISLDDYFVDDEYMPRDSKGTFDLDSVEAVDYKLFNAHLEAIIRGEEIELPRYDFTLRKRVRGEKVSLHDGQIILVEGIHALNELLTDRVARKNKYKIYLSALTSLCLDEYNAFSPTDNRLLRRIVRDAAFRNTTAEDTFTLWKNVRRGEMRYIFPFEGEADEVFNSSLIYELAVLKSPAQKLLAKIKPTSPHYSRAQRLAELLMYFEELAPCTIPPTSIIREFIGGSTIL